MPSFDFYHYPEVSRVIDLSLYSRYALAETQAAYRKYCQVQTEPKGPGYLLVTLTPLLEDPSEVQKMVLEFWNYFLDKTCQEKLG